MSSLTNGADLAATLLLEETVIDDPYPFYRRLVAEAPVWCVPGTEIVVVSSFGAVSEAVSRVEDFSSNLHAILYRGAQGTPELLPFEAGGLHTLAVADPPVHTAHRRTVFPELVVTDEDGERTVAYEGLVGLLIEAVRELDGRVRALEQES